MVEKAAQPVMVPSFFTTQQSHAFPSIYANSLTVKMSHSDFSILFGHDSPNIVALTVGGRPGQGVSSPQPDVLVNMSLATTKSLARWLSKLVDAYESEFGTIKVQAQTMPTDEAVKMMVEGVKAVQLTD